MTMITASLQNYRWWSLLFVPCLLWSCLPSWQDVGLLTTFVVSQVLFYSLHNMRGMLILSTLVLLLWTKNLFARWYRSQVLTREFFKNLLYLGLTVGASLLAVFLVWMPLYEAYACAVNKLDKGRAQVAMEWRNSVFLFIGACLATSAVTQTDLVLRPSQVDNSSLVKVVRKLVHWLYRMAHLLLRQLTAVWRATRRCMRAAYGELYAETQTLMSKYGDGGEGGGDRKRGGDTSEDDGIAEQDEDIMEELRKQIGSRPSSAKSSSRTRSMDTVKRNSDTRRASSPGTPHSSYASQSGSTRRLRSHDKLPAADMATDPQSGPSSASGRGRDSGRYGSASVQKVYIPPTAAAKSSRGRSSPGRRMCINSGCLSSSRTAMAAHTKNRSSVQMKNAEAKSLCTEMSVSDRTSHLLQQRAIPAHGRRSSESDKCTLNHSPASHQLRSAPGNQRVRSSLMDQGRTSSRFQSGTSLNISLSEMLQSSALPPSPLTRSQARLVHQDNQGVPAHGHHLREKKTRAAGSPRRFCPNCD